MIHQLLIKIFLFIFVINVQLIGIWTDTQWLMQLAGINLLGLIILLFQHRADLTELTPEGKRTLFAPGVFLLIAGAVSLWLYGCLSQTVWDTLLMPAWRGSIAGGLLFWVTTVLGFSMLSRGDLLWKKLVQGVVALLILLGLGRIGLQIGGLGEYLAFESDNEEPIAGVVVEIPDDLIDTTDSDGGLPEDDTIGEDVGEDVDDQVDDTEDDAVEGDYDPNQLLRYRDAIPLLVEGYDLSEIGPGRPAFALVDQNSQLYESFRIAQQYGMVGTNINPDWIVQCENAMVLRGLAEGWTVNSGLGVLDAYWAEAQTRGLVVGTCAQRDNQAVASILFD